MRARPRPARRTVVATALLLLGAVGVGGCADPATPRTPEKAGTGQERDELAPLLDRIPALAGATDATWFSGSLGSRDVPGPSLNWIDAVVTLPAGAADELRATLDLAPATQAPDVVDDLDPALPDGDLLTGEDLDAAFSAGAWDTTAFLSASGDELVLVIVGE